MASPRNPALTPPPRFAGSRPAGACYLTIRRPRSLSIACRFARVSMLVAVTTSMPSSAQRASISRDPARRPRSGARDGRPRAFRPTCPARRRFPAATRDRLRRARSARARRWSAADRGWASSASLVKPASGTMSAGSCAAASAAAVARPIAAMRVVGALGSAAGAVLDGIDAHEHDQIVVGRATCLRRDGLDLDRRGTRGRCRPGARSLRTASRTARPVA